ncbi:MAG: MBL fold metallo-hydrolase [Leptospiraceae bacterium]|nr:MBL fold metallo-hydrolase [Leptospiraceae bacterium]MDW7974960.1 MBL fold metallo-hydrolase [Leptospiraceae bacterium]
MKNLIVLGSGNAYNLDGRGHSGFLLDSKIMIDCGATVLLKANQYKVDLSSLDVILITHFHGDHYSGIPFLLIFFKYVLKRTEKLMIVGPKNLKTQIQQLIEILFQKQEFPFDVEIIEISPNETWKYQNYTIQTFPINHKEESIGYKIFDQNHSFAFTGDSVLDEFVFKLMDGVDVGIMEVSFLRKEPESSHISLEEVMENRAKIKTKRLFFNHLYDEIYHEIQKINHHTPGFGFPLYDGMVIEF